MTPFIAATLIFVGLLVIYLLAIPGSQRIEFGDPAEPTPLGERLQNTLRSAGIFDQAPSLYILAALAATAALAVFLVIYFGNVLAAIPAPFIVFAGIYIYIFNKQRRFLDRAYDEMVPFLNKIATSAAAGKPVQQAYLDAVESSGILKEILSDSAAKIASGAPIGDTLVETIPILPIRMWAVFVRQIELYSETGGDFSGSINKTIKQINEMLQLQAEARADYSAQLRQQQIIFAVPVAMIIIWTFFLPGGASTMKLLVTTGSGLLALFAGLVVLGFGFWFLNKQLRQIQERLAF